MAYLPRHTTEALREAPRCCRMRFAWVSGSKLSGYLFGFNQRLILILLELVRLLSRSACSTVLGTISSSGNTPVCLAGSPRALLRKPNSPRLLAIPPGMPNQPSEAVEQEELQEPQHQSINKQHFDSHSAPFSAASASKFNSRVTRCLAKHPAT